MMAIAAAVLAGGTTKGELREACGVTETALIALAGRPMGRYVVDALARTSQVDDVVIVAPAGSEVARSEWPGARTVTSAGGRMIDSIAAAAKVLADRDMILVAACDMPLVTPEALAHLSDAALAADVDCCYSMVERRVLEARYPGSQRTWVRLRDGVFTGGNVVALRPSFVLERREVIERAFSLRKRPLRLARMLGFGLVIAVLLGLASSDRVAARASEILDCTVAVVKSPYAEIGIDVDKPSDLEFVKRVLGTYASPDG